MATTQHSSTPSPTRTITQDPSLLKHVFKTKLPYMLSFFTFKIVFKLILSNILFVLFLYRAGERPICHCGFWTSIFFQTQSLKGCLPCWAATDHVSRNYHSTHRLEAPQLTTSWPSYQASRPWIAKPHSSATLGPIYVSHHPLSAESASFMSRTQDRQGERGAFMTNQSRSIPGADESQSSQSIMKPTRRPPDIQHPSPRIRRHWRRHERMTHTLLHVAHAQQLGLALDLSLSDDALT